MIDLHFSKQCAEKLKHALRQAGEAEIGGVLAAEHLSDGVFEVIDLSVQRIGGAFASFRRWVLPHRRFLQRFFMRTGRNYQRFNYLGEWHSHPSFPAEPSTIDVRVMQRLIESKDQDANFIVLVVVKLNSAGALEGSAHAFRPGLAPVRIRLHLPGRTKAESEGVRRRDCKAMLAQARRGAY